MFQQARENTQPVNTPILQSMDEMLLSIFNEEGHATYLLDENEHNKNEISILR